MSTNRKNANDAVILSAARTPIGKLLGALSSVPAPRLGAVALKAAVERAQVDASELEQVIMGQVVTAGTGQAPARQASIFAGFPSHVGAFQVNKVCGSGLVALMQAAQAIRAGDSQLLAAGGMESMSNAPHLFFARQGVRYGDEKMYDANIHDGLWDPFEEWMMGNAAEFIADEYEVTREAMDQFALASHQKAIAATDAGKFQSEIVPVEIEIKGKKNIVATDEAPRRDTSLDALARLKPTFAKEGRVTAGNAPGLNDGAAAVVVAAREYAQAHQLEPLARVVGYTSFAVEPKYIFDAPSHAIPRLLKKIGWALSDVDLIEINEAFAAQVLANGYALAEAGWSWSKVNVNGGAIALGHPIGASGARIVVTLLHALRERNLTRGIAAACLGGGEAVALALEVE